jgi:hypothetical protein
MRSDSRFRVRALCVALLATIGFALAGAAAAADGCDPLRDQIDAKIRNAGVEQFTLAVVDAAASAPGKVVGTCDRRAKKIVYVRGQSADAAAPSASAGGATPAAKPRPDAVVTECKDGTVSVAGTCGK